MMMMVMFLMAFDAVAIAVPLSLQVLMLPFLYVNLLRVALSICLFAPGCVLVTRF